jgi:hypothetical protein
MDAPEDRSKAINEHMSSGFAPRADIVTACPARPLRAITGREQMQQKLVQKGWTYSMTSSAKYSRVRVTRSYGMFGRWLTRP